MIRVAASPADAPTGPDRGRGRDAPVQHLAQDALLDARHAPDLLERLVAAQRVLDVLMRRHDRLDEADPAGAGLEVEAVGVMVDEVLDERLGLGDRVAPGGRVLAHDLVGVLAGRQAARRARPRASRPSRRPGAAR